MKKIFTLWRIITSNIMMMKKLLFSSLFLLGSLVSQAQHEYTIKGEVKGVKDGTHVSLFLTDGRVGSIVGTDTTKEVSLGSTRRTKVKSLASGRSKRRALPPDVWTHSAV